MWPNPQETADLATFTEEILNGKLHFLCSASLILETAVFRWYWKLHCISYLLARFTFWISQFLKLQFQSQQLCSEHCSGLFQFNTGTQILRVIFLQFFHISNLFKNSKLQGHQLTACFTSKFYFCVPTIPKCFRIFKSNEAVIVNFIWVIIPRTGDWTEEDRCRLKHQLWEFPTSF